MKTLELHERYDANLSKKVEKACQRIAPLWPLKSFVAVNPYFGLGDQPFWEADKTLRRITGVGLTMPRAYYREQIRSGRISSSDLSLALWKLGSPWDLGAFEHLMASGSSKVSVPFRLVANVLDEIEHRDWSAFVVERISHYCAGYFDEGQALWPMPWRGKSLYQGWLEFCRLDKTAWMMGLRGFSEAVMALPRTPQGCITMAVEELGVTGETMDDYLHAALLSVGGWAGWARYQRWQAELKSGFDDTLRDLLAVRLAWDLLLYRLRASETLKKQWQQSLFSFPGESVSGESEKVDWVLQTAFEIGYQRELMGALKKGGDSAGVESRPAVQAVFCIDVRSEIFRRALETVSRGSVQTLGFAGFFGVLVEFLPLGAAEAKGHLPILFNPSYRIREYPHGADTGKAEQLVSARQHRIRASHGWKTFKTSASSCFSFVESFGLLSAGKLVGDSMGWSRTVHHPDRKGLSPGEHSRLAPQLASVPGGKDGLVAATGIPEKDRAQVAEFALSNMGMTKNFGRLVLLAGHGSTTVNNPQATGLDCGACAGQTGEASARIAATLLNDPKTRSGLAKEKGIHIPSDTFFVAGLHDTTTDEVQLFDTDLLPSSHREDLATLRQWLASAGEMTRMERSVFLGTGDLTPQEVREDMIVRTRDWAQVRPEWALAGNAAFIAAPRARTVNLNLQGRSFLHDYNWHEDKSFATLQLIMTAPMVVGNWINMQYYGSVVDNRRFGSGNKVLHNVVGGSIGVLEGNGGDLRVGLAMQSLHDGERWIHEPVRLNVVIEAPKTAIDDVIARHELVRNLIENEWIYFFQIDDDGQIYHRCTDKKWEKVVEGG